MLAQEIKTMGIIEIKDDNVKEIDIRVTPYEFNITNIAPGDSFKGKVIFKNTSGKEFRMGNLELMAHDYFLNKDKEFVSLFKVSFSNKNGKYDSIIVRSKTEDEWDLLYEFDRNTVNSFKGFTSSLTLRISADEIDTDYPKIIDVNPIYPEDKTISGIGRPGDKVVVKLPDGQTVETIVDMDGKWSVDVPEGSILKSGDEIIIYAEDKNGKKSEEVKVVVKDYFEEIQVNPILPGEIYDSGYDSTVGRNGNRRVRKIPSLPTTGENMKFYLIKK